MKRCITVVAAAAITASLSSTAVGQSDGGWVDPAAPNAGHRGLYMRNGIGANLLSSVKLEDRSAGGDSVTGARIELDTGFAWQIDLGWQLSDLIAVEFTSGILYSSFDSISGSVTTPLGTETGSLPIGGSLLQVPFLIGPTFSIPLSTTPSFDGGQSQLRLRLGVAAGGMFTQGKLEGVDGLFTSGSDSDVIWAYAITAGLDWDLTTQMSLGLTYRFIGTDSSSFEGFGVPNLFETKGVNNQLLMATFSIRF